MRGDLGSAPDGAPSKELAAGSPSVSQPRLWILQGVCTEATLPPGCKWSTMKHSRETLTGPLLGNERFLYWEMKTSHRSGLSLLRPHWGLPSFHPLPCVRTVLSQKPPLALSFFLISALHRCFPESVAHLIPYVPLVSASWKTWTDTDYQVPRKGSKKKCELNTFCF